MKETSPRTITANVHVLFGISPVTMATTFQSYSPMQHALGIPDLCNHLASHLPRADLFELAQTNKCLGRPALDWIWRDTPNIVHLIALLPREAVTVTDDNEVRFSFNARLLCLTEIHSEGRHL